MKVPVLDENNIAKLKKIGIGTVHILDKFSARTGGYYKPKLIKRFKDTDSKIINISCNKKSSQIKQDTESQYINA